MAGGDVDEESASSVMFCEVFSNFGNKILEFFNKQRDNQTLCDCAIVVENIEFPAHICVVGASSDVLLQDLIRAKNNFFSKICLPNVTYAGFRPLFEYMYSGVLKFEMCHIQLVHHCAMSLGLRDLEKLFDQYAKSTNLEVESRSSNSNNVATSEHGNLIDKHWAIQGIQYGSEKDSTQDTLCQLESKSSTTNNEGETQIQFTANNNVAETDPNAVSEGPHILKDYLNLFATLSSNATPNPPISEINTCPETPACGDKPQSDPLESQTYESTSVKKSDTNHTSFCFEDVNSAVLSGSKSLPPDVFQSGTLCNKTAFPPSTPESNVRLQVPSSELPDPDTGNTSIANPGDMQLRRRRKLKCVDVSINDDQNESKTSERTVYQRTQAPFSIDPSQSTVQIGENLSELLRKYGVTPHETTVTTIVKDKVTPRRKRTKPRKLQQPETIIEHSVSTKLSKRTKAKRLKCKIDKNFDNETQQKAYNCPQCPRGFFRESSLKKHCDGHALGGIHKCQVCNRSYVRLCDFTRHVRSHGTLRCEYCEFSTKSQKQFVDHNTKMHSTPKPFRCHFPDCAFSSGKLHDLDEHRLIHSNVKCFTCNFCGKTFSQKGGLYSHKKSCLQKRDFLCDICGRAFNHLGSMKSHRRIHIGEKPFQCSECNTRFSDHRNLKRHKLIHENLFPYTCEYCDKLFRHSNSLKSHVQKQHFPNGSADNTEEKLTYLTPPANPYMVPLENNLLLPDRPAFDNQAMTIASQMFPVQTDAAYINQLSLQPQL